MLKPYTVYNEVSIDGGRWRELNDGGEAYTMIDEKDASTKLIVDKMSFDEFYRFLDIHPTYGTVHYLTMFKKRRVIGFSYSEDWASTDRYKTFKHVSMRRVYKEVQLSLLDIMKQFDSDIVIKYLKERGITTCPIIDTKQ